MAYKTFAEIEKEAQNDKLVKGRYHWDLLIRMQRLDVCSRLDEMLSPILGRPVRYSWRLFIYIALNADVNVSGLSSLDTRLRARYMGPFGSNFETFATILLHDVARLYFYINSDVDSEYFNFRNGKLDDELWNISQLVCEVLEIHFDAETASKNKRSRAAIASGPAFP